MSLDGFVKRLGFASYADYLAGEHWQAFKKRYYASGLVGVCLVCGSKSKLCLHHVSYRRIGQEDLSDVVPLCRVHHEDVHQCLKAGKRSVSETLWAVGLIREELAIDDRDAAPVSVAKIVCRVCGCMPRKGTDLCRRCKGRNGRAKKDRRKKWGGIRDTSIGRVVEQAKAHTQRNRNYECIGRKEKEPAKDRVVMEMRAIAAGFRPKKQK